MKQAIKILILILWLLVPFTGKTQIQPFRDPAYPTINGRMLRAPGDELPNGSEGGGGFNGSSDENPGGPPGDPPNGNEGEGGWVGMPVKESFWILPILAVGYGVCRRRKCR
jgi:hypothetical protein